MTEQTNRPNWTLWCGIRAHRARTDMQGSYCEDCEYNERRAREKAQQQSNEPTHGDL